MTSARQDGREHLTMVALSLPFREIALPPLLRVYAGGSLACASLKWHTSRAGKEINSAHLHRKAEMGPAFHHGSWQDHASRRHLRNLWKNFRPSQSTGVMSVSSIFSCPTLGAALPCCPRGQAQTDRRSGDRQRGRPGEEPVAMLMWQRLSGATVTLPPRPAQRAQGTASGFFSLPQAAFIFHTSGNWTLSSVIEFLGCRACLWTGNWMQCFLLWTGLQLFVMGQLVIPEDGLFANEGPHSCIFIPCVALVESGLQRSSLYNPYKTTSNPSEIVMLYCILQSTFIR